MATDAGVKYILSGRLSRPLKMIPILRELRASVVKIFSQLHRLFGFQRKLKITGDNARDGNVLIQIFPAEGKTV
jgi:hypothetical protein